jgi:hypothetical protein
VLLNVPAAALGFAALYHFHAWLDTGRPRDRTWFVLLTVGAILIYLPGGLVLPIAAACIVTSRQTVRPRVLLALGGVLLAIVVLTAVLFPAHVSRHAPSLTRFLSSINWVFYTAALRSLTGPFWGVLAVIGLGIGFSHRQYRREAVVLTLAFAAGIVALAMLPARDERYALVLVPLVVLASFFSVAALRGAAVRWAPAASALAVAVLLALAVRTGLVLHVHRVTGIEQVARYLRANAPTDGVLYSGLYDGVFGYYVRALDDGYQQRVLLPSKLLYNYTFSVNFIWVETPYVTTPEGVVSLIQHNSGCQWVAVERVPDRLLNGSERLLRQAVETSAFERVHSFDVLAGAVTQIDLYRSKVPVDSNPAMDLMFPSFSAQVFRGVEPIPTRRFQ